MVDVAALMQILMPALPFLMKMGEKAIEGVGQKIGEDVWAKAKAIWGKLAPKVEADPVVKKAMEKAVSEPKNSDRLAAAKLALQDLLEENPALANELAELLKDVPMRMDGIQVRQQIGSMQDSKAVGSINVEEGNVSF